MERHPVFRSVNEDFIARMIEDFRDFTARYSPARDSGEFKAAWADRANADDSDVTQFLPHYAGSPIVAGEQGARSGAKGVHEFRARAGHHLAPNTVSQEDLWSRLGPGFTLLDLVGDPGVRQRFDDAARRRNVPFRIATLADHRLEEVYGCGAMLVRPDQFLAWAGTAEHADAEFILDRAIGA